MTTDAPTTIPLMLVATIAEQALPVVWLYTLGASAAYDFGGRIADAFERRRLLNPMPPASGELKTGEDPCIDAP